LLLSYLVSHYFQVSHPLQMTCNSGTANVSGKNKPENN